MRLGRADLCQGFLSDRGWCVPDEILLRVRAIAQERQLKFALRLLLLRVGAEQVCACRGLACSHCVHSVGASLVLRLLNGLAVVGRHQFVALGDRSGRLLLRHSRCQLLLLPRLTFLAAKHVR